MKWDDTYRKLFFDFHSKQVNHSVAADFDAEAYAEKLVEVGCEMTSVFAVGGMGHKFYQKGQYCKIADLLGIDWVGTHNVVCFTIPKVGLYEIVEIS